MEVLPSRPFGLRKSFLLRSYLLVLVLLVLGPLAAGAALWWQGGEARAIVHQGEIWRTGKPAAWAQTNGTITTRKFFFHEYKLDVIWGDKEGHKFSSKLEFSSLHKTIDDRSPPKVQYDPNHPQHFALSYAIKLGWSRWALIFFDGLTLAGLGIGIAIWGVVALREVRHVQSCATTGQEISLQCTHIELLRDQSSRPSGVRKYFFSTRAAGSGAEGSGSVTMPAGRKPLFRDENNQKPTDMVALRSAAAPDHPLVLRDDLYPLSFTDEEAQLIRYRPSQLPAR